MTGRVESSLFCDRKIARDGREGRCGRQFDYAGSLPEARHAARKAGWVHAGQQDYCPTHIPGKQP